MPVAALNVALLALTFVTVQAGDALKNKLKAAAGNPADFPIPSHNHEDYGTTLLWVMVAPAALTVIVALAVKKTTVAPMAITGVCGTIALVALGSLVLTVITGHTGSESHWGYLYQKR